MIPPHHVEETRPGIRPLYLDVQATTPLVSMYKPTRSCARDDDITPLQDPRVLDVMLPYLTSVYGNPHSRTHAYGWESEEAVEKGRKVRLHSLLVCVMFSLSPSKWQT